MTRMARMLTAGFVSLACALAVLSWSQSTLLDLKSAPTIKALRADQIDMDKKKNLIYELPAGNGFFLDTSEYKSEYEHAVSSNTLFLEVSIIIRLDPVATTHGSPLSVKLVPGRDLYPVCPNGGLRSGDKYTVEIAKEVTNLGHYDFSPHWIAVVSVK